MITLKKLDYELAICKLHQTASIPEWVWQSSFYAITKTEEELSLVCEQEKVTPNPAMKQENGWKCLQVVGPLDFSLTGILSSIAQPLANNKISIFAISTYDTDYVLVKKEHFDDAQDVLTKNGFAIV